MSSRRPRPTWRRRNTTRVESARPGRGLDRSTKVAENGSVIYAVRGSGWAPLTRSSRRERNRMSRKNSPWGDLGEMSPDRPEMQNEEPSTSVTVPDPDESDALSPANVQGWGTGRA